MDIRFAGQDDIPVIQQLVLEIWPKVYSHIISPAQISYMLDKMYSSSSLQKQFNNGHQFLLTEENKIPAGFAAFSEKDIHTVQLQKLYVLPENHGKGIGKSLIFFMIAHITPKGINAIELNVNRENKAVEFYKKLGFKIIHSEDIDIGNGFWMNDYVMRKDL